ncbi:inner-membrane translocator [Chloroherpeton thalassium ATCC 35110]|uniref:Inner-membrane translocator n=1 Tax=Chloroherpeton thalassium (strain ATCC 35110 / GB-78) TaxID=517418 RepID=B3QVW1_CHLT3|nr:ABC transporter permease [Chloroherpeton thalassium]ACF13168.1 inner-membrane translocator [Chloroherpeton thalassium ATCC 35110]
MLAEAIGFLFQVFRIGVPYLLTSLGATYSERGGVINLALDGLILVGAFGATVGQFYTESAFLGIFLAVLLGLLISLLHAYMTITLKANQIVSGVAINILVAGLTQFFLKVIFNSSSNSERIAGIDAPNVLLNPIFIFAIVAVPLSHYIFFYTPYGLRLRATGENAKAVDSLGISVSLMRYSGVLISGVLAALAGAFLAFEQHSFTDGMSAGRGYISLAAMIIGKWQPLGAAAAGLMFAATESMELRLQSEAIPSQLIQALPYLITIVVLIGFIGKSVPPREDGIPYEK